ncbi:MAG: AIR carboxylase family protein [Anaerolineae bacterium]|nr:AIR carboxylase family protein [Anaerolineae bacterium]
MSDALVPIIMGSKSDQQHAQQIAVALAGLGLESELRIASAFTSPGHLLTMLTRYERDPRPKVYIAVSSLNNALAGAIDATTAWPVIACPPRAEAFGGADVFSSLRLPGGLAPAVVLDPGSAALLAAKILGVADAELRERVREGQRARTERLVAEDAELQGEPNANHNP